MWNFHPAAKLSFGKIFRTLCGPVHLFVNNDFIRWANIQIGLSKQLDDVVAKVHYSS